MLLFVTILFIVNFFDDLVCLEQFEIKKNKHKSSMKSNSLYNNIQMTNGTFDKTTQHFVMIFGI